jgi:hypothetical protein
VILPLSGAPALAQQPEHEEHHPAEAPPAAGMQGPGMPGGTAGMPMMGMMRMMMGADGVGGMSMMGMMRMMMGADGVGGMSMMAGHVEGRLAFLKTELKITDAQLPLWNAVADTIRANAKSMSEAMGGMIGAGQAATLPDKLALREKIMSTHLEALRRLKTAVDPLYAALSPEQKKSAARERSPMPDEPRQSLL